MFERLAVSFFAVVISAGAAAAQDFSEGSKAREMGLYGESKALFEAEVVDVLCMLSGDCPDNCGDGRRQLGLVRGADDVMVLPLKNRTNFNGAVEDLIAYCGQTITVDGLLLRDDDINSVNVFMLQSILEPGATEWKKANVWPKTWKARNPDAAGKGGWQRRDPRILAELEKEGYLGLGLSVDAPFIADWFAE